MLDVGRATFWLVWPWGGSGSLPAFGGSSEDGALFKAAADLLI